MSLYFVFHILLQLKAPQFFILFQYYLLKDLNEMKARDKCEYITPIDTL